ncbi:LLM class oxidoreductase [Sphingomonas sp. TDK1]|uniref:LLM class oxidoreductase n=1 Tax=Sphingomonas sp. TDK1 TaxID=453247 RepID=UPI0007D9EF40|nr:LLM class oxidoreductase [Sphingomonas sp. TDK1]OAN63280.1 LLM class oxidoreductase [Sphingomonas sp. TDK1]
MYKPSTIPYLRHRGFQYTFKAGRLSLGLFFPIEAFQGDMPTMLNQVSLAQRAEDLGFSTLWFRDVPLRDPTFGDVGQIFDPWVYLGFIAGQTSKVALGTASIAIPLRHPLHTAKAAASVDQLSGGRLLLGVATGDRPVEFPAFGVDPDERGEIFRENLDIIRRAQRTSFEPLQWTRGLLANADLIPKPTTTEVPFFVTGNSRQSVDWIARESSGWMNYPRPPQAQQGIVESWRKAVSAEVGDVYKPFLQSLYIDLDAQPSMPPTPIHLGFKLGRDYLMKLLEALEAIGVDHVILNLKYGRRPAAEVVEELGSHVVPRFGAHTS